MFAEQRIEKIKSILLDKKSIDIGTLASLLNVSEVTVRRDINKLQQEGFLVRTHGGIVLSNNKVDINESFHIPSSAISNFALKDRITDMAATLIEENDSIFLGEGTTCYLLAKKLKEFSNITVVTNNLSASLLLAPYIKNIYLISGELIHNRGNLYTGGPKVASHLSTIFVNKAFISSNGFDVNIGFTIQELSQLNILSYLPNFAAKIICMIDSTKFGYLSVHKLAPPNFANIIITDKHPDAKDEEMLSKHNVRLIVV